MSDHISDERLTAYLDGEADQAERVLIEAAVAADAEVAARLASLDVDTEKLKSSLDILLGSAPTMEAVEPAPARSMFGTIALAASLVVGIALGGLWSPLGDDLENPGWKMAVANYQVLYVPETLAVPSPDEATATRSLSALSEVLGRDLTSARDTEGLEFRRAQQLGLRTEPLIQMAYVSSDDVPFAICVTKVDESDYAPKAETLAGLASAHWVRDGYGYLVIGGDDLDFVERVAADLRPKI